MLKRIQHLWKTRPRPLAALWKWARKPNARGEARRFGALRHFAGQRETAAWRRYSRAKGHPKEQARAKATAQRWHRARLVYKRRQIRARKRYKHRQQLPGGGYEVWMLNGHSSNIDDDLKPVVAFVVSVRNQVVTDTYDYSGHAPSSLHYPRNDPTAPQQGHAIDSAGGDMCGSMTATRDKFGAGHFLELFGPCPWYIKNGGQFSGMFPGHGDHQHSAVA